MRVCFYPSTLKSDNEKIVLFNLSHHCHLHTFIFYFSGGNKHHHTSSRFVGTKVHTRQVSHKLLREILWNHKATIWCAIGTNTAVVYQLTNGEWVGSVMFVLPVTAGACAPDFK